MKQSELKYFEHRLLGERKRAQLALDTLAAEGARGKTMHDFRWGALFEADHDVEMIELGELSLLLSLEGRYLFRIEAALHRLRTAQETYGLCRRCGAAIPFQRLNALPYTRLCLRCAEVEESSG